VRRDGLTVDVPSTVAPSVIAPLVIAPLVIAPLVIGAGPAGTAAAITLARAGHRPTLIERNTGPTDKVCGDFLSIDAIQQGHALGVDFAALGAAAIHRIRVVHRDRVVDTLLPFPALGLSRRTLDAALLRLAVNAGAVVHTGQTVRHLSPQADRWRVQTGSQVLDAATVFLATGKHDLRDAPRRRDDQGAIGMKMYLALAAEPAKALQGATELTLFRGGYAGMQCVENGRVVLCVAVKKPAFAACGADWSGLITTIGQSSRRFAAMMAGSRPLLPRPLAVAGIPYGYQARQMATRRGLFRLGDQAAVIPSLTGDGMAIALYSGQQAARAWLTDHDAAAYQRSLAQTLTPQMRLAGLLHGAGMNALTQTAAIPILRWFPGLLRHAASRTRLPNVADGVPRIV
jgi:flavin-dependent dehydrogenase